MFRRRQTKEGFSLPVGRLILSCPDSTPLCFAFSSVVTRVVSCSSLIDAMTRSRGYTGRFVLLVESPVVGPSNVSKGGACALRADSPSQSMRMYLFEWCWSLMGK